jgi:uncharacterized C2H2 Zn-finger protein
LFQINAKEYYDMLSERNLLKVKDVFSWMDACLFKCPNCDFKSKKATDLSDHMAAHHGVMFNDFKKSYLNFVHKSRCRQHTCNICKALLLQVRSELLCTIQCSS